MARAKLFKNYKFWHKQHNVYKRGVDMRWKWSLFTRYFYDLPFENALEKIRDAGFRQFDYSRLHLSEIIARCYGRNSPWLDKEMMPLVAELIETYGLANISIKQAREVMESLDFDLDFIQAHGPLDTCRMMACQDERARDEGRNKIMFWLDLCRKLDVPILVLHLGRSKGMDTEKVRSYNIEGFKKLAKQARDVGVKIAIENGPPINEIIDIIRETDEDHVGICLDTGHANIKTYKGKVSEAVLEAEDYLIAAHVHDNDGSSDQHLAPGEGTINWGAVMNAFETVGYQNPLSLEIFRLPPKQIHIFKVSLQERITKIVHIRESLERGAYERVKP